MMTKTEIFTEKIENILKNKNIFTWSDLGVSPYKSTYWLTYDGKLIFDIIKKLNISYDRVSNIPLVIEDHGNKKYFFKI